MFLLFRSCLRVHRNRRCIYMLIVWQTKSSKLFWNLMDKYVSEHANNTIRVWFETIINQPLSTYFLVKTKFNMFHNLIIGVLSFPFPRFLGVNEAQAVSMIISTTSCPMSPFMRMWTNSWRLPPTHQLLRTRSKSWFLFESPKNLRNDLNLKSDCWISGYTFYNYMIQLHLSIYILLCSHIYKYRNMQVIFFWW